jgi:hypothetical protein
MNETAWLNLEDAIDRLLRRARLQIGAPTSVLVGVLFNQKGKLGR